ncbi:bifunctional 2-keto-4-hydroxyglutarate aldolase/2-keto-3-deoxy-6-phosphogluconate aldolase, partial [Lactococcus petauri]|nr:bifunctional 2-keto-4-hydroxyglutarate aldolase/2-keto-3-deoxy-6-phosphogluconate aldolase [Lactococcus petauri]
MKEVDKICNMYQIPYITGVMTPLDSQTAMEYGSELINLFPGDIAGAAMNKDLKGPITYINVMPSVGVIESNEAEW